MVADSFFGLIACLYYCSFVLLGALSYFIAVRGTRLNGRSGNQSRGARHRARLSRAFFALSFSLLLWQSTLYFETRTTIEWLQLWLGRLNFAAVAYAPYSALLFIQAIPVDTSSSALQSKRAHVWSLKSSGFWMGLETALLMAATGFTPLICAAEKVEGGRAITTYGALFPLYLAHVISYLLAALLWAVYERHQAVKRRVRRQLLWIAVGMLATGGIGLVTNALLPYIGDDFRFCDLGALSTVCFLLAAAYATLLHGLFELRVVLRETLVYGCLLAFVLGAYSSTVFVVSQGLTDGAGKFTQFAVLLIAFSFDPLRRFLEEKADELLFDRSRRKFASEKKSAQSRRKRSRLRLALLFPWRHP